MILVLALYMSAVVVAVVVVVVVVAAAEVKENIIFRLKFSD